MDESLTAQEFTEASTFAIGFHQADRAAVLAMWEGVFDSNRWTEGPNTEAFESAWETWNDLPSVALSGWTGGARAALDYVGVQGHTVLCPSNTFMATPLAVLNSGGKVAFVDCNRNDLCMSFEDFQAKAEEHKPKAAWVVHIGGHIAFEIKKIAAYCKENDIWLIEDCAHAHGASWNGRKPGSWGDAGVYSFYATKTISTGEGGMLVSKHDEMVEFARAYRNYGKPEHQVAGLNYRMSEFTAALGLIQTRRMEDIVSWKNAYACEVLAEKHVGRLELPLGMVSGYYKYIVFDPIEKSTGKVYEEPCHRIMEHDVDLPNTDWVAQNHWCVPIYYHGG